MGGVSVRHLSALSGSSAEHIELLLDDGFRALASSLEWSEPHDLDGPDLSFDWVAEALADTAARLPEQIPAPAPTALLRNAAVVRWSVRAIPVAGVAACAALMAAVVHPEPPEVHVSAVYPQHGGAADGSASAAYAAPSGLAPEPAADAGPRPNPAVRMRSIALTSLLDTDEAGRRADSTVGRAPPPQTSAAGGRAAGGAEPGRVAAPEEPAPAAAPAEPAPAATAEPASAAASTQPAHAAGPTKLARAGAPAEPAYAPAPRQPAPAPSEPASAAAPAGPTSATAPAEPASAAALADPVYAAAQAQPAPAPAPSEPAKAAAPGAGAAKPSPADLVAGTNPSVDAGAPAALARLQAAAGGGATRKAATAPPQDDTLALPTDPSSGPAQRAVPLGGIAAAVVAPRSTERSSEPRASDARTELSATGEKARSRPTGRSAPSTSHERSDENSDKRGDDASGHGEVSDR
jgi:hypothetical protein